ncbi:MAG: hypothetical protein IJT11_00470 [Bacteroidaceae bacterium]|nr:hypothetical protein [Bacteroidaceae bacterium]
MKKRLILNALLFCVSTSMVAQTSNKLDESGRKVTADGMELPGSGVTIRHISKSPHIV